MKKMMIVMVCVGLLVGCKSTVVTPEGTEAVYSKAEGVLRSTLEGSVPDVVNATNATLEDLELVGIDNTVDKLKGKITARMAVGTKVSINLESVDFDTTRHRFASRSGPSATARSRCRSSAISKSSSTQNEE